MEKVKQTHVTEFLKFQGFVDELMHRLIDYERFKISKTGWGWLVQ